VQVRGPCPGCGQDRALPGRRPGDEAPVCTRCAGFSQSLVCSRCGYEDKLHRGRLCSRCTLADQLSALLDDGSGQIRPGLVPLADSLLAMDRPRSGLGWLSMRKGQPGSAENLLRRLGRGEIELTHEAFLGLENWRAAAYLRELLMACGVLPAVDKQAWLFERWLPGHLAGIPDEGHVQLIRRFATWDVLPRLRARAERRPLTTAGRRYAGEQVKAATAFLQWLAGRGTALANCRRADVDAWYADDSVPGREMVRHFVQWCMATRLTGRLRLPSTVTRHAPPLSDDERARHLGRVLTAGDLPLRTRAAAASLLAEWTGSRDNMNTATNRNSRWLFPGRRAGQPMNPTTLAAHVTGIGVPTVAGRTSAIRQHVMGMPAPVVADALSYHPTTTSRLAAQAGSTFSRYAPGGRHQAKEAHDRHLAPDRRPRPGRTCLTSRLRRGLPVHLDPVTVRVDALERHHAWLVVVLDDLDLVRSHLPERGADVIGAGQAETEVKKRLCRPGLLPGVQREVEPVGIADDDGAVGIPLRRGRLEAEIRRVEVQAAGVVTHRQAEMRQVHGHENTPYPDRAWPGPCARYRRKSRTIRACPAGRTRDT
jgi:hypothetical protein